MFLKNSVLGVTLLLCVALLAGGCAGLVEGKKSRETSSVVDFLYPNKSDVTEKPAIPELTLPINVGIAFVPATGGPRQFKARYKALQARGLLDLEGYRIRSVTP